MAAPRKPSTLANGLVTWDRGISQSGPVEPLDPVTEARAVDTIRRMIPDPAQRADILDALALTEPADDPPAH